MKNTFINTLALSFIIAITVGCGSQSPDTQDHNEQSADPHGQSGHSEGGLREVHMSDMQMNSLGMKIDTMPQQALSGVVEANGQLTVPPQHIATVTAILGANITSIKVIEGDEVHKGEVLAYLSHPNLTKLQMEYVKAFNKLQFLKKEYQRQKRLYEEKVGAGKAYQEIQADYASMKGEVKGYEVQLSQLNINAGKVRNGEIYEHIPVVSPIDGFIEKVLVQVGQYVDPQKELFMIVNNKHIHADLMVFEKDVYKVKEGQKVYFTVQSVPDQTLSAKIFAVGKQFEQNPKAVHVHADIEQKEGLLIPGMYINGKIHTSSQMVKALPEGAIIEEDNKSYIFTAKKHDNEGKIEWHFNPVEIKSGIEDDGWVEVNLLKPLPAGTQVAWNNAYYLISEMKKSQTSHHH